MKVMNRVMHATNYNPTIYMILKCAILDNEYFYFWYLMNIIMLILLYFNFHLVIEEYLYTASIDTFTEEISSKLFFHD